MTLTEPGRGRPRDPRTHDAITAATRRLLTRDGYDQVSIEAIARAAGVSRPTVYRRWPSKAHVVFDAAFADGIGAVLADSGDFETDLRHFVRDALEFWHQPVVSAAVLGILGERKRDPALHIRTQQLLDEQTLSAFTTLVARGIEQGAVRSDLDADTLYHTLIGSTFYAAAVQQRDFDSDDLADRLCTLLIRGTTRKGKK